MSRAAPLALALALAACSATAPRRPAPSPPPGRPVAKATTDPEAWRRDVPTPGPRARLVYPVPDVAHLDNGLSIWVVRRPAEVVALSLVVRHGASALPKGKSGLAALTARMLTEGTKLRSASALAEAAESLGSTLEHDAGRDYSSVSLTTLRADVEAGLSLLAEVVQEPAFSPRELERVKREWLDSLTAERQAPERLASLAGLRLLLGEPHGAPVGGSVPDVKRLTTRDLAAFHAAHFVPASSALIVVGDVDPAAIRAAASKSFGAWTARPPPPEPPPPATAAPDRTRVVVVDRPGAVQCAIFAAQPFPRRSDPGHEARQLLTSLLGGLFTSRINLNLREKNAFTYGARADAIATRAWGALVVTTRVEASVTAPALKELVRELARARDPQLGAPIADQEVARARADLTSTLGAHLVEVERVAGDVATLFVHGLPPGYLSGLEDLLAGRSTAEVSREAQRIDESRLVVVIVGDRAAVAPTLEAAGFTVTPADPALTL